MVVGSRLAVVSAVEPPPVWFARPAHARGLELVRYPNLARGWRGIPEAYRWFTLIARLDGEVDVLSGGVRARCEPGSLTVGEPGEPYVLRPRSAMRGDFRVIRIDNQLHDAIVDEIGAPRGERLYPAAPQRHLALARAFAQLYRASDGEPLETQEALFTFVSTVLAHGRGARRADTRNQPAVERARALLHQRFDGSVSLDELARAGRTDKFALLRAFSRELGMTPHAYQVQLRMARACRLIARQVPLGQVALEVGYSEQSALNRVFKRLVGVTPGTYANAAK
jgi:AraC-like DNA-binding protein